LFSSLLRRVFQKSYLHPPKGTALFDEFFDNNSSHHASEFVADHKFCPFSEFDTLSKYLLLVAKENQTLQNYDTCEMDASQQIAVSSFFCRESISVSARSQDFKGGKIYYPQ